MELTAITPPPILAAHRWKTNGHLIAACHRLGYLTDDDLVVDPTFGRGTWWSVWRPKRLVPLDRARDGTDFRRLAFEDHTFDVAAFDPPYVAPGGRDTSTIKAMHGAYGMADTPRRPAELQEVINDGLTEMVRVVKPGGIVLVKCMDYVSSGRLWLGTHHTLAHALALRCELRDRFEMITEPRPQPTNRVRQDGRPVRQQHARRNYSTLLVLHTAKARPMSTGSTPSSRPHDLPAGPRSPAGCGAGPARSTGLRAGPGCPTTTEPTRRPPCRIPP